MFYCSLGADLQLRPLEVRHAAEIFARVDADRQDLRDWLPWVDGNVSQLETETHIRRRLRSLGRNDGWDAGIWCEGQFAGCIGFHRFNWAEQNTAIGYWLGVPFRNRGIMTKACEALVRHAFDDLQLNRVEIRCATGNVKSCAIPERLGFTREGCIRQAQKLHHGWVDHVIYGRLRTDA